MVNILQTVSKAFSWMKIIIFWFKFHWHRILWVQLTIYKHWFWSRFWPSDILACCNHVSYQTCTWWDSKQTLWGCLGENKLIQYGLVVVYVMIVKIWAYVMNKIDANCAVSAPEVVIMTTSGAASKNKVGIMTTLTGFSVSQVRQ